MTRPTVSRQILRQAVARELQMRFFRRFPTGSTLTSTGSTTTAIDSKLPTTADSDYWVGDWFYATSGSSGNIGKMREIVLWNSTGHTLTLDAALPSTTTINDGYEIYSRWTPEELNQAINRSIEAGSKGFFDQVTDESLIICENKMTYDLSTLTTTPWLISSVWAETNPDPKRGEVTAADATSITDSDADFTGTDTDYIVSIYDGKGAGQQRNVASLTGTTKVNVTAWTTTPDTTSKYTLWDPTSEQGNIWHKIMAARFNAKEYPDKMYLSDTYSNLKGLRLRVLYAAKPTALSADTDVTYVPQEYIVNKACAILYGMKIGDNRSDRQKNTALEQDYALKAENYMRENAFRVSDRTLWQEREVSGTINYTDGNPMGW